MDTHRKQKRSEVNFHNKSVFGVRVVPLICRWPKLDSLFKLAYQGNMHTIGQRLREARERKGVSLRDASEEIKVRADYLGHFEEDCFDFGLPGIYRRGFLELYGQYLDLDMKLLVEDYLALSTQSKKKAKREAYGQVELSPREEPSNAPAASPLPSSSSAEAKPPFNRRRWILVGSAAAALCICSGTALWLWSGGESSSSAASSAPVLTARAPEAATEAQDLDEIELVAQGDVHVIVRQEHDKQKLLKRKLVAGDRVTLKKRGAIKIHFSEGSNLQVIRDGRAYSMNARGVGVAEMS